MVTPTPTPPAPDVAVEDPDEPVAEGTTTQPEDEPLTEAEQQKEQKRQEIKAVLSTQTGNLVQDILDGRVPLGMMDFEGSWSLLNLILSLAGLIIAIIVVVTLFTSRKKKEDDEDDVSYGAEEEEEERKKRSKILKVLTAIAGVIVGILFLILENLTLPVTFINKWTPLLLVVFIIHIALLIVQLVVRTKDKDDDQEDHRGEHVLES